MGTPLPSTPTTIKGHWTKFRDGYINRRAETLQKQEMHFSFYAGAISLAACLEESKGDHLKLSLEIDRLAAEAQEFFRLREAREKRNRG